MTGQQVVLPCCSLLMNDFVWTVRSPVEAPKKCMQEKNESTSLPEEPATWPAKARVGACAWWTISPFQIPGWFMVLSFWAVCAPTNLGAISRNTIWDLAPNPEPLQFQWGHMFFHASKTLEKSSRHSTSTTSLAP